MKHTVFVSYASRDRSFAESLKPRLAQLLADKSGGVEVVDVRSAISAKTDVRKKIQDTMSKASTVVIVSSPEVDRSEWVNYEAGLADALGKDLVIVGRKGAGKSALVRRFQDSARFIELDDPN